MRNIRAGTEEQRQRQEEIKGTGIVGQYNNRGTVIAIEGQEQRDLERGTGTTTEVQGR